MYLENVNSVLVSETQLENWKDFFIEEQSLMTDSSQPTFLSLHSASCTSLLLCLQLFDLNKAHEDTLEPSSLLDALAITLDCGSPSTLSLLCDELASLIPKLSSGVNKSLKTALLRHALKSDTSTYVVNLKFIVLLNVLLKQDATIPEIKSSKLPLQMVQHILLTGDVKSPSLTQAYIILWGLLLPKIQSKVLFNVKLADNLNLKYAKLLRFLQPYLHDLSVISKTSSLKQITNFTVSRTI
jgi:hypothetical protein